MLFNNNDDENNIPSDAKFIFQAQYINEVEALQNCALDLIHNNVRGYSKLVELKQDGLAGEFQQIYLN